MIYGEAGNRNTPTICLRRDISDGTEEQTLLGLPQGGAARLHRKARRRRQLTPPPVYGSVAQYTMENE
jgi:hypothetical protein